jgi:hypothetical protein
MMSQKGKELEQLVRALESAWANKENVKIESPKRLRDKRTNALREHDVILTISEHHHDFVVAMECRDRSRPVGVNEVEAFHQKCLDTSVDKGVIVSSRGFTDTARKKAEAYGVRCLDINKADRFDWFFPDGIVQQEVEIVKIFHSIVLQNEKLDIEKLEFIDREGARFGKDDLFRMLHIALKPHIDKMAPPGTKPGLHPGKITFRTPELKVVDKETARVFDVVQIISEVLLKVTVRVTPFSLFTYSDKAQGVVISEAASAQVGTGDFQGKLIFSHKKDGGTQILFSPDRAGNLAFNSKR